MDIYSVLLHFQIKDLSIKLEIKQQQGKKSTSDVIKYTHLASVNTTFPVATISKLP